MKIAEFMPQPIVLLDGGMGQELIRRSGVAPTPLWATRILLDNPDLVETVHIDFIKAGARVISLNNYTATPTRLTRDATLDLFAPIHEAAKSVARSARDKAGVSGVMIAGCLPPLVASFKPDLVPSAESCLAQYRTLVDIQQDGVDVMICETMATIREAVAAVTAARDVGLKTVVSFTLDDDNPAQLRSGEPLAEAVDAVATLGVAAVTLNCSMPETVSIAMPLLVPLFHTVGGYANGFQSVAALDVGGTTSHLKTRQDLTPDVYADVALGWVKAGAKIIGGCCEVGPAHIAMMKARCLEAGYDIVSL